jgi:cyclase
MLKKRLIFTLLYNGGDFMLSRNFSLQKVGNLNWLKENYDFSRISYSIDELIILDVTRENRNLDKFCGALKLLTDGCFVPIAAGGGITDIESARKLLRSGADKVVVNSALFARNSFVSNLASEFGQQSVVASVDIKTSLNNQYQVWSQNGSHYEVGPANDWIEKLVMNPVGEIYLNSIDKDGTGQGFDFNLLELLPNGMNKPLILAGGAGNASHLLAGLHDHRVDAVATANLFNFVGDGLKAARQSLISSGILLPLWDVAFPEKKIEIYGEG